MTTNHDNRADLGSHLKEMEQENEFLLLQLHQVQQELEHYYLRNKALEKNLPIGSESGLVPGNSSVDDELIHTLAENRRLSALLEVLRKVSEFEAKNALNTKLGNLLIEGSDSPRTLLALPGKLWKIWRAYARKTPPRSLGGAGFAKVLAAHSEGGFESVEKLIAGSSISPAMQANGYTTLARHLMHSDRHCAAEAARRAYVLDPKSYRLKWLAFRLHDAGDVIEAGSMLEILPSDTQFSDSEERQCSQLRYEMHQALQREAKQQTGSSKRNAEIERQIGRLMSERDEQSKQLAECFKEIGILRETNAVLEQDRLALVSRHEDAVGQLAERTQKMEALQQGKVQLEQDRLVLVGRHEEAVRQAVERIQEVAALQQVKTQLEQDRSALASRHEEAIRQVAERTQETDALKQGSAQLEQDRLTLAGQYEEAVRQVTERTQEVEALQHGVTQLEQDRLELAGRHEEAVRQVTERSQQVEALLRVKAQLEQENLALGGRQSESTKLAAEYLTQINVLQQQIQNRLAYDAEMTTRQKLVQEEVVRAEAQIDLIKDILLRGSRP